MDLISILTIIGIVQGLVLSVTLMLSKKNNQVANRIMALQILSYIFSITYSLLFNTNIYLFLPHLLWTGYPFILLFGPLLLFYIKALDNNLVKVDLIHLLPFILFSLWLTQYLVIPGSIKIDLIENSKELSNFFPESIVEVLTSLHVTIYIIAISIQLKKHKKLTKDNYANLKKVNLKWIKILLIQLGTVFSLMFIFTFLKLTTDELIHYRLIPLLVSLFVYIGGYSALRQKDIQVPVKISNDKSLDYSKITQKLKEYMEKEKPYIDPDLTLPRLSQMVDIPRTELSGIINKSIGVNFYDFVNSYRIEKIKKDLKNPDLKDYTILDIAYEGGFSSKATFNKCFKEYVGCTPSSYRKN